MSGVKHIIQQRLKNLSLRQLVILLLFLSCLAVFLLILDELIIKHENSFDSLVFKNIAPIISPALTRFMLFITFFGSFNFLFPAYILAIAYDLYIKGKKMFLYILCIGVSSTGVLFFLKFLFKRLRPSDPLVHAVNGYSFPSGHAFSSFTFFGIVVYIIWNDANLKKTYKWILSILVFLVASVIAFSRVYLRVHFASDVVAGFCLSVIWLTIAFWILKTITRRQIKQFKLPLME